MATRTIRPVLRTITLTAAAGALCTLLGACNADNATRRASGYSTDSRGDKWVTERNRDRTETDPTGVNWRSGPTY